MEVPMSEDEGRSQRGHRIFQSGCYRHCLYQLSCYLGPDPAPCVGSPQHPLQLQAVGVQGGASPAEPYLQNQIQEHLIAIKDENPKHGCDPRWR